MTHKPAICREKLKEKNRERELEWGEPEQKNKESQGARWKKEMRCNENRKEKNDEIYVDRLRRGNPVAEKPESVCSE